MKIVEKRYTQESHCCLPETERPELRLVLEDGGAGPFVVVHCEHWSFGDEDTKDRDEFVAAIDKMLAEAKRQNAV